MRVAVLGSWRPEDQHDWSLLETAEQYCDACRRVGRALIERGHSLIVGTDAKHTADGNAVLGAIEALDNMGTAIETPRIMVIRPESRDGSRAFADLRRSRPGLFVEHSVDAATWAVVKLVQVQLADALILVGGAEKTEQAGLTAAISQKPLACIGSFGGAASRLNKRFVAGPTTWGYEPNQTRRLPRLQEPFSDALMKEAFEVAWIEGAPKIMVIHGRSSDRDALKQYLLQYAGRVIVLTDEYAATDPIPVKFERFASSVDGAIALLTPDDAGGLAGSPGAVAPRARENVWVEVGWFWGHRGRAKLLLLKKGETTIPSDLGNVEHYAYESDPHECHEQIQNFIKRLRSASDVAEEI